ncbi:hypothetical protein D3C85_1917080 [compost metagenome]
MACTLFWGFISSSVEIEKMCIHITIGLLEIPPIQVINGIIIALSNTLPKHSEINIFPTHVDIQPELVAGG